MMKGRPAARAAVKRRVWVFLILAILLVALAVAAPALAPNDPNRTNSDFMKIAPCAQFPLGTDKLGRCVLSRVLMGARTSIFSSLCVVAASFAFGTVLGVLCGWYGGALDELVMISVLSRAGLPSFHAPFCRQRPPVIKFIIAKLRISVKSRAQNGDC